MSKAKFLKGPAKYLGTIGTYFRKIHQPLVNIYIWYSCLGPERFRWFLTYKIQFDSQIFAFLNELSVIVLKKNRSFLSSMLIFGTISCFFRTQTGCYTKIKYLLLTLFQPEGQNMLAKKICPHLIWKYSARLVLK